MKITVKTGVIAALIWIALRMLIFAFDLFPYNVVPSVMLNILGVLLSIAIGLFLQKRSSTEDSNALNDIKNGMSAGVPYTVIVSVFLYFYYGKIDLDFNKHQLSEIEMALQKDMSDPEKLRQIKDSNEEFEVMTKEEIYDSIIEGPRAFYSPGSTMAISMLSLLLLTTLNSIFVTVIYRRIVFRN
jgi:uncharacterized membrane protein